MVEQDLSKMLFSDFLLMARPSSISLLAQVPLTLTSRSPTERRTSPASLAL
jgi:hypothetical protein